MVPPTIFISGGVAVLQLCKEVYVRFRAVKRYREDCQKLAQFVQRIEAFITETEDETDMTGPGWKKAFSGLHDALLEVVTVFDACAKHGMLRSLINSDDLNSRLNSITQRLMLSLQLIPIQKAKASDKRLAELQSIQCDIRSATFSAVRAAEEQSAQLKRLMDQSRVDTAKTQEMLAQVLLLLEQEPGTRAVSQAARAAGRGPSDTPDDAAAQRGLPVLHVDPAQLEAEVADLMSERERAVLEKNKVEEQYLQQIIAAISAMEARIQEVEVPADLRCPITYQLLQDPVILVDSHQTYERAAIQEWLDRGNRKDPVSGVELTSAALVPNVLARKLAEEWHESHPEYKEQPAAAAADLAAAGAAAGAQPHQEPTPANDCFKAAAAAAAVAYTHEIQVSQGSDSQQTQAAAGAQGRGQEEDAFEPNPITAAVLAASMDPADCAAVSRKLDSSSDEACQDGLADKQLAQQAYAQAVAAAAASGGITVATAVWAPGQQQAGAAAGMAVAADSDTAVGRCNSTNSEGAASSITFARDASSRSLPSFGVVRDNEPFELRPPAAAAVPSLNAWPNATPVVLQAQQQQQQQQQQQLPMRPPQQQQQGHMQQQQQLPTWPPQQQQQQVQVQQPFAPLGGVTDGMFSPTSSTAYSRGSRQERAAAAVAAAAAMTQQQQGFGLDQLQATLGRASEATYRIAVAHGTAEEAEQVRASHQQLQHEWLQQQERAYLQQHVQHLMSSRAQAPARQQQLQGVAATSSVTVSNGVQYMPYGNNRAPSDQDLRSAPAQPSSSPSVDYRDADFSNSSAPNSPAALRQGMEMPEATTLQSLQSVRHGGTSPDAEQSEASGVPRSIEKRQVSPDRASASSMSSMRGLRSALASFGRHSRKKSDVETCPNFDDAASISSTGSARSVGKNVLGMLKSIQYTMVYEDDKC